METVKILHTADVHIGAESSFLGVGAESRRFEILLTFERIMDLAKSEDVNLVAVAGDFFDANSVEERFIKPVFQKIASLPQIKVVYAAGNHDPLNSDSPFLRYSLPENLYVLGACDDCITFEDLKLKVYGRSFEHSRLKGGEGFSLKTDDNYINLLIRHGEARSDLNSDYNPITPQFVKSSGMDYIALGHIHKATEIGKLDNTYFAYCGCPEGQGFDELGEKGIYIGDIGKGVCSLKFVPICKRQHIEKEIDVSPCLDTAETVAVILNTLQNDFGESFGDNLYKIILKGEIFESLDVNIPELTSRLSSKLYFVKLLDKTEYKIDYEALAKEPTLMGVFTKKMSERIENADEMQKEKLKKALKLGLRAFKAEVKYNED